jgi:hypothetical protein
MTDLKQAAQQALEALAIADNIALVGAAYTPKSIDLGLRKIRDSATALRTALAQPEQEPVGYVYWSKGHAEGAIDVQTLKPGTPLYTTPPAAAQRPWQGLEIEEILDLFDRNNVYGSKWIEFARTVEAKLKERNT